MSSISHQLQQEKTLPIISRLHRWFFAASIVLGTVSTLVMVATNPGYYEVQNGEATYIAAYAHASTVMVQTHLISMVITFYLLPLGLLAMAWLAMRRAPWLASIGAFIVFLGMIPLAASAGLESLTNDIAHMGSNPFLATFAQQFNTDGVMSYYGIVFIPGSIVGPVLIGIALGRARVVPLWAALLITVSRLVVFIFPFFPSLLGIYIQLPSCVLLFIGSLPAALAMLKVPSNENQRTADESVFASSSTE